MDALLIQEELVASFIFWRQGSIRQGMRFRNGLYQQIDRFPIAERPQAFEMAGFYARQHLQVVVTVARHHYTVWVSLRATDTVSSDYSVGMMEPFPA